MSDKKTRYTSEWKPFSELRPVQRNISGLGYKKEYIEEHNLNETKIFHWSNGITGVMNYFEPLEVMAEGDNIFWRYNENHIHMDKPELFETQFGTFNSMAAVGEYVYFGQNKMVTRLNMLSGETLFFTNKTDEEIAALVDIWR